MMAPSRGMAYASRASGTEQERYRAAECISRLAVVARERSGHEKGRPRRPSFARPHRHRQSGPLPADNHRLGGAVTARAGRSVDVQGGSAGAIGAGHDLVGAARSLRRVTDDPEARAGCLRTRQAWRTSRPCRTLRALSPGGSLIAFVALVSLGAARKGDEHCDGGASDKDAHCVATGLSSQAKRRSLTLL